jgi:hypothetical protein
MSLEDASSAYIEFIRRPMTALPAPEIVETEYTDVTPGKKDAA